MPVSPSSTSPPIYCGDKAPRRSQSSRIPVYSALTRTLTLNANLHLNSHVTEGATAIAEGLKHNVNLLTLDVSDNALGDVLLGHMIGGVPYISDAGSYAFAAGDIGAMAFAALLESNTTLLHLNLGRKETLSLISASPLSW